MTTSATTQTPRRVAGTVRALVRLCCSKRGCPRQLKPMMIARDVGMPSGTAAVMQPCPWHAEEGNKSDGATYWDKDGNELY